MVDKTEEFLRRLRMSATEARLRQRDASILAAPKAPKPQKQIPISLFHDMFGQVPRRHLFAFQRLKVR